MDIHFGSTGTTIQINDAYVPSYLPDDIINYNLGLYEKEFRKTPEYKEELKDFYKEEDKVKRQLKEEEILVQRDISKMRRKEMAYDQYYRKIYRLTYVTNNSNVNPVLPFLRTEISYSCYNCMCALERYEYYKDDRYYDDTRGILYNDEGEIYRFISLQKDAHEITIDAKKIMFPEPVSWFTHASFTSDECDIVFSKPDEKTFEEILEYTDVCDDFPCPYSYFHRTLRPIPCFVIQTNMEYYWDDFKNEKCFKVSNRVWKWRRNRTNYYVFLGVRLSNEDIDFLESSLNVKNDLCDSRNFYEMSFPDMCDYLINRNNSIESFYIQHLKCLRDSKKIKNEFGNIELSDEKIYKDGDYREKYIGHAFYKTCNDINLNNFIEEQIHLIKKIFYDHWRILIELNEVATTSPFVISPEENKRNQIKLLDNATKWAYEFKLK